MTGHDLTAEVTGGKARVRKLVGGDTLDWGVDGVSIGKWTCSCGAGPFSDAEAIEHLRSERGYGGDADE